MSDIGKVVAIDQYLSTAYDKLAHISDNLDAILAALAISENDHDGLINRSNPDSHPQAAITNLVTDLAAFSVAITALQEEDIDLAALLEQHAALTEIHWADVPVDDIEYVRKNNDWVEPSLQDYSLIYDAYGSAAAVEALLNAHDHDAQYDTLGAAAAVEALLDAHNHDSDYLTAEMISNGTALPSPAGYPENALFIVTG